MSNFGALNSVYNFYLTTYAPKTNSRYDTHKKSELRSVYNSIVDQNKDAPLYILHTNNETQGFAVGVKEDARNLKNTIMLLGGMDSDSLLNKKAASSSDDSIATVSYMPSSSGDDAVAGFEMTVSALAGSQINSGNYLNKNDAVALDPGTYSFDAEINSLSYEFQFAINKGDTNSDVQQRITRLINNANIGISAETADNPADTGQSAIILKSAATGVQGKQGQLFKISEDHTSKTSGTVGYFGTGTMTRPGTDAVFAINGTEHTASSNNFTVGNSYEVTLHNTTDAASGESVNIGLKTDVDSLTENMNTLIRGYNTFLQAAAEYADTQPKSSELVNEVSSIPRTYAKGLTDAGISLNLDGSLELDESSFRKTVQSGDVNGSLSPIKSFTNSLLRKSDQVSLNPMKYVDKTVVEYKNPGKNFANPYITSEYSGMLFNSYC